MIDSIALLALSFGALLVPVAAAAQASPDTSTPYKLTAGSYSVAGGALPSGPGLDVNLRYTYGNGNGNVWLGWFRSPALDFSQLRGGWDHVFSLGPVRLLPSLQSASGGFVGGSLAIETGERWFIGTGLGRTNLHAYANLNFDPNDSYTVYGGWHWDSANTVTVQLIRDNRENPDQQHAHLIWRTSLSNSQQLIVDVLEKQGTVDNHFTRRTGLSVGYDWPAWSVRAAWDPKVNFTPQNMVRLSLARRF